MSAMPCMYAYQGCALPMTRPVLVRKSGEVVFGKCEADHKRDVENPWGSVTRSPEPIEKTPLRRVK